MTETRRHLELLSPARSADIGIEAINHGADAVYIGGPSFGARANADNSVQDIARLVAHAHKFNARIFVTLNTILHDNELEGARNLVWQLYDAGADALIVQDMGLLELDLPPIQLHASTQTDIRTVEKAMFLDQVGFSQIVLARELDINTIQYIANNTSCSLEFFVHGALCVAFSGQCFISHAHTGRSANRGECSQACRLPYALEDSQGRILANDKYLLSMKDNDQSANLRALVDAGISSFKIEGRYKDMAYVKNATAHYRLLLDGILEDLPGYRRASSGRCSYTFTPQPEKTFNRSATDYFVNGRKADIGAFDTPKFAGEALGHVTKVGEDFIELATEVTLHNGDGISFFDSHKDLVGLRANIVDGPRIYPDEMPDDVRRGMMLYRNRDHAYLRLLEKKSAERKIEVTLCLYEIPDGFALSATDEDGHVAMSEIALEKQPAQDTLKAEAVLREHLSKLGSSDFSPTEIALEVSRPWFIPASMVNQLRRDAISALEETRKAAYQHLPRRLPADPPAIYPEDSLSYLANVFNAKARAFYERHGVKAIASAYEANEELGEVSLMITKHCLRFSYAMCPKEAKGVLGVQGTISAEPMTLVNGKDRFSLRFDCKRCEMHVMGKIRKPVLAMPQPVQFHPRQS